MHRFALAVLVACGKTAAAPDGMGPLVTDAPGLDARPADADAMADAASDAMPDAPVAVLTITPMSHDFGSVIIVCSAAPTTFTVTNTGQAPSAPLVIALTGFEASTFTIVQDGCAGTTLAPTASCSIEVGAKPVSPGSSSAALVATAGAAQASAGLSVVGLSTVPLHVMPNQLQFGTVAVGATSTMSFTLSNDALCPTTSTLSIGPIGGADASVFSTTNDTCSGTKLAGGQSCTVGVVFAPTAPGPRSANVNITPFFGATVSLVGATPGDTLAIAPASLDFGQTPAGMTSAQRTVWIWNAGPPTAPLSVSATGDVAAFTVLDMCSGVSLATSAECSLLVTFSPTTSGTFNAQYTVSAGAGGTAQATAQGVGGPPADFAILPKFGVTFESCMSTPIALSVTNVGPTAYGPLTAAIVGTDAGNFAIGQDACSGASLSPNATCTIDVRFMSTGPPAGAKSAALQVSAAGAQTTGVPLHGSTAPGLSPSTCGLTFNGVAPGSTATQTFTVTNEGAMMTGPLQVSQSGAEAMLFPTTGCAGQTLALFESCTTTVTFKPTSSGTHSTYVDVSASPGGFASVPVYAN